MKEGSEKCHDIGIDEIYQITPSSMPLEKAMDHDIAVENLIKATSRKNYNTARQMAKKWHIVPPITKKCQIECM